MNVSANKCRERRAARETEAKEYPVLPGDFSADVRRQAKILFQMRAFKAEVVMLRARGKAVPR